MYKLLLLPLVFFLTNCDNITTTNPKETKIQTSNFINKSNCDQIIDKQVFNICYDYKMKGAKYVSYTLKGTLVNKLNIKKRNSFYTEKNLKNNIEVIQEITPIVAMIEDI